MVDMTAKSEEGLDVRLEATVKASRTCVKQEKKVRVNWDVPPHCDLRKRIADSWIKKEDLYAKDETMHSFCQRCNFSRAVLVRYLRRRRRELAGDDIEPAKKRGRPTHLSESVMRHICEGKVFELFFICELFVF